MNKRKQNSDDIFEIFENLSSRSQAHQKFAFNFARKHFSTLSNSPKFYDLPIHVLFDIFKEDVIVDSQELLCESIMNWIRINDVKPNVGLNLILSAVKLPQLSFRVYLQSKILPYASQVPDYNFRIIMSQQVYLNKLVTQKSENLERAETPQICEANPKTYSKIFDANLIECVTSMDKIFKKQSYKITFVCKSRMFSLFLHVFNYYKNSMQFANSLPKMEIECFKTAFFDNRLMILGGIRGLQITRNIYLIHIKDKKILQIDSLNLNRSEMGVVQITTKYEIEIYAIGGWKIINDMTNTRNEAERWDSNKQKWKMIASMNQNRGSIRPAVLNGKIYVAGGYGSDGTSMERYDPETDTWTMLAPMKQHRKYCTLVAYGNKIYAIGGASFLNVNLLQSSEQYDPETNSWSPFIDFPLASRVHAFSIRNKLFCYALDYSAPILFEYDVQNSKWMESSAFQIPQGCIEMNLCSEYE